MEEEDKPIIDIEYPLFNNIINSKVFDSLRTSEKIEFLLQKDIFFLGDLWIHDKFYCQEDFDKLDFSIFKEADFCINETFKIDDTSIGLNPLIQNEVFKGICDAIWFCPTTSSLLNEVKFQSITLSNRKEKEKYLRGEINKINPFHLKNLSVEFNWNINQIYLAPELSIEILLDNPKFIEEWVTGKHSPGGMFIYSHHPDLHDFYSDYQKFLIAEFCLNELQNLESKEEEITEDNLEVKEKFTAYEQTYFLVKTGLIKKLRDAEYSEMEIARLVSKVINRSFDNVRKDIRKITSERIEHPTRESSKKKIDKIIKDFTNLG